MYTIEKIQGNFSISKIESESDMPHGEFVFISKTDNEISVVCRDENVPERSIAVEDGWNMMRIVGTLDFSLIGVLSGILSLLAENGIGVFVISTFDTDYILTKSESFERALEILSSKGYKIL